MSNELERLGVLKIRFNYVFFQKVTKDDAVVSKELLDSEVIIPSSLEIQKDISQEIVTGSAQGSAGPGDTVEVNEKEKVLGEIGKLISLRELIDRPDSMASSILSQAGKGEGGTRNIISQLRSINEQISSEVGDESNLSLDELMESVFKLTSELKQGLSIQKEMGNILKEEEQVINEVDQLTYQTIIKIIREEYKQGSVSVKRLSQIIRRILPEVKDLKKLLPQLKNGLLAAGMSLSDFLQLTKELHKELEGDGLLQALEMGAEKLGLTVEDIVQAINTNPQEAAKIIVLASEIKQGTGTDQAKLSTLLTEYIESVSSQIALESNETAGQEGGKILENVIHQIETELIGKLKTQGVADSVLSDVEKQLTEKFPKTLQKLKTDWIVNAITDGQDLSSDNLLQMMGNIVNKKADFETVKTPIEEALRERGIEADQVEDIFNEIVSRFEKNKNKVPLPKNVLSSNNTKFFLQREIKENMRYHNPFSCIAVSVNAKFVDGIWQKVSKDDSKQVIPEICKILKGFLRDLDLVGSLGKLEEQNIVIILPMTDEKGAYAVKGRLDKKFLQTDFVINEEKVELNIIVSVTPFDTRKTSDYKSFKELISTRHKIEEDMCSKL